MDEQKNEFKQRTIFWTGFAVLFAAALVAFYFFYLLFWPFVPIEVKNNQSLPVIKKELTTNEEIGFVYDYCKKMDIQPRVVKEIISENNVITVSPVGNDTPQITAPSCGTITIYHEIPDFTPPGKYRLYVFASYPINAFRSVNYTFRTEEFEVKEATESAKATTKENNTSTTTSNQITPQSAVYGGGNGVPVFSPRVTPSTSTVERSETSTTTNTTTNNNTTTTTTEPAPSAQPSQPSPTPLLNIPILKDIIGRIL